MFDRVSVDHMLSTRDLLLGDATYASVLFPREKVKLIDLLLLFSDDGILDLCCGNGRSVLTMRNSFGLNAIGLDAYPGDADFLIQDRIESMAQNEIIMSHRPKLIISVYGFGAYLSDKENPEQQLLDQIRSIRSVIAESGIIIFTVFDRFLGGVNSDQEIVGLKFVQDSSRISPVRVFVPMKDILIENGFEEVLDEDAFNGKASNVMVFRAT